MVQKRLIWLALSAFLWTACGEDEVKTYPPVIVGAELVCGDDIDEDFQVVEKVLVEITDSDRDLVPTSIHGSINGLVMDAFVDPDADEKYEWIPSDGFDPPMICRGEFTVIIEASDIEGQITRETLVITP